MTRMLLVVTGMLALSAPAWAASKDYQVTGPVLAVTADTITVQKGKENWEIGRGADTKVAGDVKVGDKVTVMYRMTAASIESKGGAKPAAKKK